MKTPKACALEAIAGLAISMSDPHRNRTTVAQALTLAISTMEIMASHGASPAPRGHKDLRERNPELWSEAELTAWTLTCKGGHRPEEMLEDFQKFAEERLHLKFPFPPNQIMRLARTMRSAA